MQIENGLVLSLVSAGIFMTVLYLIAQIRRDTSIVDIAWGLGFFVIALNLSLQGDEVNDVFSLVHLLVAIWGIRLFIHILLRKAGSEEDWRYAKWRQQWGKNHWWRSFLQVFMLQGVLMVAIAAPLYVAWSSADTNVNGLAVVGTLIWALGFFFETVGDYQLAQFLKEKRAALKSSKKKKPKKEFMTLGLWKYTRHPNYFGEVTQWWGLWVVVASLPYGLFAVVSPLIITFLLLKVSGIPMLEDKWEDNKEFKKYKQRTNAFFPGPPRKK